MDRREEDAGAIAWPGFVDILSAVIIMFVFFVMILAIIMFVMTIKHKESVEVQKRQEIEEIKQQLSGGQDSPIESDIPTKTTNVQEVTKQNEELNQQVETLNTEIEQLKADLAKAKDQQTLVNEEERTMVVLYKRNEISLAPETEELIKNFLQNNMERQPQNYRLLLETGDPPNASSLSMMRELSLARTLNIRNVALSESLEPSQVSVTYTPPEEIDGSYQWVRIKIVEAGQ